MHLSLLSHTPSPVLKLLGQNATVSPLWGHLLPAVNPKQLCFLPSSLSNGKIFGGEFCLGQRVLSPGNKGLEIVCRPLKVCIHGPVHFSGGSFYSFIWFPEVRSLTRLAKNFPVLPVCTAAPLCLTPCWMRTQLNLQQRRWVTLYHPHSLQCSNNQQRVERIRLTQYVAGKRSSFG